MIVGAHNTASVSSNNAFPRLVRQSCQPAWNSRSLAISDELIVDGSPARGGVTGVLDSTTIVIDLRF
ncbi:hypothetical protein GCM10023334_076600 [Nonomuraea thailandensis]